MSVLEDGFEFLTCTAYNNLLGNYSLRLEGVGDNLSFEDVCDFLEVQTKPIPILWGAEPNLPSHLFRLMQIDVFSRPDLFMVKEFE